MKNIVLSIIVFVLAPSFCDASTDNIAPVSKVEVSTSLGDDFSGLKAIDGIIGVDGKGEWACEGILTSWGDIRYPWLRLSWEKPQIVNKVVLYDRVNLYDNIAGGKLLFSDGTVIFVNQIPDDGTGKAICFESKTVSWIKFFATDGDGKDLGLSEIEVFSAPENAKDLVAVVDPYI